MSYTLNFTIDFTGTPPTTLNAALYDAANPTPNQIGDTITTGFTVYSERSFGFWLTIPDDHVGAFRIWDADKPQRGRTFSINPQEAEYSNAKTSEVAQSTIAYNMPGGYTFYQMVIDLWAVSVGNATANAAENPTSLQYEAPGGGVQVTHTRTSTTRTNA